MKTHVHQMLQKSSKCVLEFYQNWEEFPLRKNF